MSNKEKVLLVVDMQNDFMEGGSLPVTGGKSIVPIVNNLIDHAEKEGYTIIGTKDFHPIEHISFASNKSFYNVPEFQIYLKIQEPYFWPNHCVIGSKGGELNPDLHGDKIERFFYKGSNALIDSYSAFFSNGHIINQEFIEQFLKEREAKTLFVCGLAEDFCVMYNALDARKLGYEVYLVTDASKPVFADKLEQTLKTYKDAGVKFIDSKEFCEKF